MDDCKMFNFKKTMKLLFVMFALTVITLFSKGERVSANSIPNDAIEWNGHYYYCFRVGEKTSVNPGGITWDAARKQCEQLGGHLVTINSAEEQAKLEEWLPEGGISMLYIGATATSADNWQWITGEPMIYKNILYSACYCPTTKSIRNKSNFQNKEQYSVKMEKTK